MVFFSPDSVVTLGYFNVSGKKSTEHNILSTHSNYKCPTFYQKLKLVKEKQTFLFLYFTLFFIPLKQK